MPLKRSLIIAYTVVPMTTSLLSILGSSVIMAMIVKSKKKFGDPYRRIVFGISFFDFLQSISVFFKIFKTTPEQPNAWFALGNQTSCNALGFLHFAGLNGALLYNVSLNIYLLCLIRYNMEAGYYRIRVEPFLHGLPILWAIASASTIVGTGHMNPAFAGECLIAPYPVNCLMNPNVECIRGERTDLYRTLFRVVPTFTSFIAVLVTLGMLWWTVKAQERKMDRYRSSTYALRLRASRAQEEEEERITSNFGRFLGAVHGGLMYIKRKLSLRSQDEEPGLQNRRGERGSYPSGVSRRRLSGRSNQGRHFLIQARWFVLAFILTHTFPIIVVATEWGGNRPPVAIVMLAKIFTPLQGLLNIIVYTRPHVHKERARNPSLGWWPAFKAVIASGGDDDDERTNRLRGSATSQGRTRASNRLRSSRRRSSARGSVMSQSSLRSSNTANLQTDATGTSLIGRRRSSDDSAAAQRRRSSKRVSILQKCDEQKSVSHQSDRDSPDASPVSSNVHGRDIETTTGTDMKVDDDSSTPPRVFDLHTDICETTFGTQDSNTPMEQKVDISAKEFEENDIDNESESSDGHSGCDNEKLTSLQSEGDVETGMDKKINSSAPPQAVDSHDENIHDTELGTTISNTAFPPNPDLNTITENEVDPLDEEVGTSQADKG